MFCFKLFGNHLVLFTTHHVQVANQRTAHVSYGLWIAKCKDIIGRSGSRNLKAWPKMVGESIESEIWMFLFELDSNNETQRQMYLMVLLRLYTGTFVL